MPSSREDRSSSSTTPPGSGSRTPKSNNNNQHAPSASLNYFSYPVSHVVSGLYRRLTDQNPSSSSSSPKSQRPTSYADANISTTPEVFTPRRTASPFQPPPLTPLTLSTCEHEKETDEDALQQQLLSRALAEEIRLLVPARLQLVDSWRLAYSLDRDGASLSTLYAKCRDFAARNSRAGFVLVVSDASPRNPNNGGGGAVFGAYMTDPPHPDSHYFGTGECFLWRASVLPPPNFMGLMQSSENVGHDGDGGGASGVGSRSGDSAAGDNIKPPSKDLLEMAGLPPPPSADTTNVGRSTTLRGDSHPSSYTSTNSNTLIDTTDSATSTTHLAPPRSQTQTPTTPNSGTSTPERIRFKAFPYSGVNEYMMFCETGFLSLGGGDGHYGLWLDSGLEKGVSAGCQTFGNEPLSDEGVKFDVIGVEVWYVGA